MHFMFAPYGAADTLRPTTIRSACHRSGVEITLILERGRVASSSHEGAVVIFAAPLREWYVDLVAT